MSGDASERALFDSPETFFVRPCTLASSEVWYPVLLVGELAFTPFLGLGNSGAFLVFIGTAALGAAAQLRRIRVSLRSLVIVCGSLVVFNAPYNLQRVAYQLLTIAVVALFFAYYELLSRQDRLRCMLLVLAVLLSAMILYATTNATGLDNAYADWSVLLVIPFLFLIRLVAKPVFTVTACVVLAVLCKLMNNNAALAVPFAVLLAGVLPSRIKVKTGLLVSLVLSLLITALIVKYVQLIPLQGVFMRGFIWNEMYLQLTSSIESVVLGVSRFRESGYLWLTGDSLLLDPRQSYGRAMLFNEMTHNYVFSVFVFGGIKGAVVVWLCLQSFMRGLRFDSRIDLAVFGSVFIYLTFNGFKLLSPDGVSIASAILLYATANGNSVILGNRSTGSATSTEPMLTPPRVV